MGTLPKTFQLVVHGKELRPEGKDVPTYLRYQLINALS